MPRQTSQPSPRTSRAALAATLSLGMALGAVGLFLIQQIRPSDSPTTNPAPASSFQATSPVDQNNGSALIAPPWPALNDLAFAGGDLAALRDFSETVSLAEIRSVLDATDADTLLGGARITLLKLLLARWASSDPADALEWIRLRAKSSERAALAAATLSEWAKRDPLAATDHALRDGSLARAELLQAVLETWGQANPDDAQIWLTALPPSPLQAETQRRFLLSLARTDPIAAADFASQSPRSTALPEILSAWAEDDPLVAVAWAVDLPPGSARAAALNQLAGPWAKIDLAGATRHANSLTDPDQRTAFIHAIADSRAAADPQAALAWAQTLPEGFSQNQAAAIAIQRWAETAPAEAAQHLASSAGAADSIHPVLTHWTAQAPADAARWTASLPDSELRSEAIYAFASQWANDDPQALGAWLDRQPASGLQDAARFAAASRLTDSNPALAADWSARIAAPHQRKDSLHSVVGHWMRSDPDSAAAWLANADLEAPLKAALVEPSD